MKDLYRGTLVRLASESPETMSKSFVKWERLSDSSAARLHSSRAGMTFFEKDIEKPSEAQHYFCIRAIEDDRLLGDINLDVINNWASRNAFVGIGINNREDWGKGYGTEAIKLMRQCAVTEVNLYRVTLTGFEYNPRAIRSYEKAGFRHEGRLRGALLKDGKRWDVLYMGILCDDWMKLNSS